jgi:hypothetical protein
MNVVNKALRVMAVMLICLTGLACLALRGGTGAVIVPGVPLLLGQSILAHFVVQGGLRSRRLEMLLWLGLVALSGLVVGGVVYRTQPVRLFDEYVTPRNSETYRVIRVEWQGGMDEGVYIHFKSQDGGIRALLDSQAYCIAEPYDRPSGNVPQWWRPELLKDPVAYIKQDEGETRWLLVSACENEAYFAWWDF